MGTSSYWALKKCFRHACSRKHIGPLIETLFQATLPPFGIHQHKQVRDVLCELLDLCSLLVLIINSGGVVGFSFS